MSMKGVFITGTNTEVGKTVVTRAITRALVHRGLQVGVAKPVESGAAEIDGRVIPADTRALMKAAKYSGTLSDICAYCFTDPVSPHLAADRAGVTIESGPLLSLIEKRIENTDISLVEGAGGFLVPLSDDLLLADVIQRSGLGLIIVTLNVLGTINSTLLAVEAAQARDIPVIGVILNRSPKADFGNAAAIAKHGGLPILGEFPDAKILENDDYLAELAEKFIDLDRILDVVG